MVAHPKQKKKPIFDSLYMQKIYFGAVDIKKLSKIQIFLRKIVYF